MLVCAAPPFDKNMRNKAGFRKGEQKGYVEQDSSFNTHIFHEVGTVNLLYWHPIERRKATWCIWRRENCMRWPANVMYYLEIMEDLQDMKHL
mmetsp:Transcript_13693/g.20719  ORF Transcript_13693/g.20719 Transcript_13693/m.20719 type:complete len:92 (-) Transcript_13693:215-490(-)